MAGECIYITAFYFDGPISLLTIHSFAATCQYEYSRLRLRLVEVDVLAKTLIVSLYVGEPSKQSVSIYDC